MYTYFESKETVITIFMLEVLELNTEYFNTFNKHWSRTNSVKLEFLNDSNTDYIRFYIHILWISDYILDNFVHKRIGDVLIWR